MKYFLFAYSEFYPRGGWNDFKGEFSELLDALKAVANIDSGVEYWHIVEAGKGAAGIAAAGRGGDSA